MSLDDLRVRDKPPLATSTKPCVGTLIFAPGDVETTEPSLANDAVRLVLG